METRELRKAVRQRYAAAAHQASCCGAQVPNSLGANLYAGTDIPDKLAHTVEVSLGCGNPVALAELKPGEVVLDLGSGGGLDVLLVALKVGPSGMVYGLDITEDMLRLARRNQRKAGIKNARFLKGEIETIPFPDSSVDVIMSNCVVNLSPDKDRVLKEAFRVLRPGGRLAIADIVVRGEIPQSLRQNLEAWTRCVAGALEEREYREKLEAAGFEKVSLEPLRTHSWCELQGSSCCASSLPLSPEETAPALDNFFSAFIRATRPQKESLCSPT